MLADDRIRLEPFPNPEAFKFRDRRDDTTGVERIEGETFWKRNVPPDR